MKRFAFAIIFCLASFFSFSQPLRKPITGIFPQPVSIKSYPGSFRLDSNTVLVVRDSGDRPSSAFFNDYLKKNYGFTLAYPTSHVYFDYSQSKKEDSLTIGGYVSLQKVYSYEPQPQQLGSSEKKQVMGAQANVWTEYIGSLSKLEYQIFPRLAALSEVLWSPVSRRNWTSFERRLPAQLKRYDLWNARYSRAFFTDPKIKAL